MILLEKRPCESVCLQYSCSRTDYPQLSHAQLPYNFPPNRGIWVDAGPCTKTQHFFCVSTGGFTQSEWSPCIITCLNSLNSMSSKQKVHVVAELMGQIWAFVARMYIPSNLPRWPGRAPLKISRQGRHSACSWPSAARGRWAPAPEMSATSLSVKIGN